MSAIIRQKKNSPSIVLDGPNSRLTRLYTITGTNDDSTATTLLLATAPASSTVAGVPLTKRVLSLRALDEGAYEADAEYTFAGLQPRDPLQEGESSYQFETAGGTIHITRALDETVFVASGTPPGFEKLIGVNGDEVAGVDIVSPVFSFSETHVLAASAVDTAYKLALFAATGTVNNGTWKGFAAGEVLFLGASGTSRGDTAWQINYRFLASKNETGLTIGAISSIAKKGHEYLWVKFDNGISQDRLVKKIDAVVVDKVYADHDFANIGIGT
jgi:hypothetical protein